MSAKDIIKKFVEGPKLPPNTLTGDVTPGGLGSAAKKTAETVVKKVAEKTGPKLSEEGLRHYTGTSTKEEAQALHKWRMKNDMEYKHEQAMEKLSRKGSQPDHHVTDSKNFTKKAK